MREREGEITEREIKRDGGGDEGLGKERDRVRDCCSACLTTPNVRAGVHPCVRVFVYVCVCVRARACVRASKSACVRARACLCACVSASPP